jgi:hypothetical protein
VVDEVLGEQFVEDVEVPAALDFFGVSSDDLFEGVGVVGHGSALQVEGLGQGRISTNVLAGSGPPGNSCSAPPVARVPRLIGV